MEVIRDIKNLQTVVEEFLESGMVQKNVMVDSRLRKPMRDFKKLFPNLFYFAYGLGKDYHLILSKEKFRIDFFSLTPKCKKFFIEYTGLKIDPHIDQEMVHKLDPYLGLTEWFDLLSDVLLFINGEKEFISKHYDVEKKIWADLKKSGSYNEWKEKEIIEKKLLYKEKHVNGDEKTVYSDNKFNNGIYCTNNNGKYFLSIDLKAANYQVLRSYGLIKENTWMDYMKKYIDHPYFGKLKKMRLRCLSFPEIYAPKQKICWQNIILGILESLITNGIMEEKNLAVFNGDEIVFHTTIETMVSDKNRCKEFISKIFPMYDTSIDAFQLFAIAPPKPYFVKFNPETKKVAFKCVNARFLPSAIELWNHRSDSC